MSPALKLITKPTINDLPIDHPFRNKKLLAAIQVKCPNYKTMTNKEYEARPFIHPANVAQYGLVEVFPPYATVYPEGNESWKSIDWPSHVYTYEQMSECQGHPAILQITSMEVQDGCNLVLKLGICFTCELVEKIAGRDCTCGRAHK